MITQQSVLDLLNEAVKADRFAINQLIINRVDCNDELANHPTIQVRLKEDKKTCDVGLLGIINGILEHGGEEKIAAYFDETKQLVEFVKYEIKGE